MLNLLRELVMTLTEGPCSGIYFTISNRFGEPSLGINLLISGFVPGSTGDQAVDVLGASVAQRAQVALPRLDGASPPLPG